MTMAARYSRRGLVVTMQYEFRVDGTMSETARAAFVDMRVTEEVPQTIIDGEVVDDAHLHGIVAQLRALGFTVVSIRPIPS